MNLTDLKEELVRLENVLQFWSKEECVKILGMVYVDIENRVVRIREHLGAS